MRELILYIVYRACGGRDLFLSKNPFQYRNATILITVIFLMHLIQVVLLFFDYKSIFADKTNANWYFFLMIFFFIFSYVSSLIFSKKILAKSINKHKDSAIGRYAKLIVAGYMIVNALALFLIMVYSK
jgi:magnesium-transporting ATPase (P-type)